MANNNQSEKFSRIVEYKGIFDVSQILASFKKMKQELEGRGASRAETQRLEEEMAKIEQLNKALSRTAEKGFRSPKDFENFIKRTEQMSSSLQKLSTDFEKVNASALSESIKNATNQSTILQNKTKILVKEYVQAVKQIGLEEEAKNRLINAGKIWIKDLKNGREVESQIGKIVKEETASLEKNILLKEKDLKLVNEQVKELKEQLKLSKDAQNFDFKQNGKSFYSTFFNTDQYLKNIDGVQTVLPNSDKTLVVQAINETFSQKTADFNTLVKKLKQYNIEIKNSTSNIALFNNAFVNYKQTIKDLNSDLTNAEKKQDDLSKAIANSKQALQNLQTAEKANVFNLNDAANAAKEFANAQKLIADIQVKRNQSLPGLQENKNLQEQLNNATERGINDTQKAILEQQKLDSAFNQVANRVSYLLSFMNIWRKGLQTIRQTFQDIQKIDKAFASIAMVTDYNISDLWEQYDDYAAIANELGQSTEAVIQSSALYYQQGNDLLF